MENKEELEKSNYLPVGSIVLLKGATQNVIIIGFAPIEHGQTKVWDYLGAPYPIGVISSDKNLLFDNEQIDKVIAKGYSDDTEKLFRMEMEQSLKTMKRN